MLAALIVDDEAKARAVLSSLLGEHCPEVTIVGMAENVPKALEAIHTLKPDLVFLDIEMPGYSGFQLLEMIPEPAFQVIFTTAYSDYALRAFEVSAIDYLLKPLRIQKLKDAVAKAARMAGQHQTSQRLQALKENMAGPAWKKICLPVSDGFVFVPMDTIAYLEAEGSYTRIHKTDGSSLLISKVMRDIEAQLAGQEQFMRCHRSYVVNLHLVTRWIKADGGTLVLETGSHIPINKESREQLQQKFGRIG